MSGVKRYDVLGDCDGGYLDEAKEGRAVLYTDYDALVEVKCELIVDLHVMTNKHDQLRTANQRLEGEVARLRLLLRDIDGWFDNNDESPGYGIEMRMAAALSATNGEVTE